MIFSVLTVLKFGFPLYFIWQTVLGSSVRAHSGAFSVTPASRRPKQALHCLSPDPMSSHIDRDSRAAYPRRGCPPLLSSAKSPQKMLFLSNPHAENCLLAKLRRKQNPLKVRPNSFFVCFPVTGFSKKEFGLGRRRCAGASSHRISF